MQPIRRERLTDLAYDAVRESIISGSFAMGERLVETQLAGELEMSRAPIREALQRLAQEGLVEERPHQGSFVRTVSAKDVADLYNARLGIERVAIRLFMRSESSTAILRKRIRDMQRAADRNNRAGVVRQEMSFHRDIVEASQNAVLIKLFGELEGYLLMVMALDDASFEDLAEIAAEHEPVVDAIESGDEAAAVSAYGDHIISTVGELLTRLGGDRELILVPLDGS